MKPNFGVILLAAGESSRLGQTKQLVQLEGTSLVRRAAELLLTLEPGFCLVVTGSESTAVTAELEDLPVQCQFNPSWKEGMGASIACGARSLPAELDGVMLFLCDQWRITTADITGLYKTWCEDTSYVVASGWAEITGPPVIFPARCIERLTSLAGDQGARLVIDEQSRQSKRLLIDNARYDLDTPADMKLLAVT